MSTLRAFVSCLACSGLSFAWDWQHQEFHDFDSGLANRTQPKVKKPHQTNALPQELLHRTLTPAALGQNAGIGSTVDYYSRNQIAHDLNMALNQNAEITSAADD